MRRASADMRFSAAVTACAAPLFLAACAVPDGGLFRERRYRDVHLYGQYADGFLRGELPYRDVFVEYPPGAFAVFLPPAILDSGHYNPAFKLLMALCGLGALFAVVLALLSIRASRRRIYAAAGLLALSPLAVGPISLNTYDLWPAALTVGALAALLRGRHLIAFALLGLALTAKVYPAVLVFPALLYAWSTGGVRAARNGALVFAGVVVLVMAPFAAFGGAGLWDSLEAQASRGLQIESFGAAVLLAADQLGLYSATVVRGSTGAISRDLSGGTAAAVGDVVSTLQVFAVVAVCVLFARRRDEGSALAIAFAAAVASFLAWNRFVSPQYAVWLIPLVLVVPGRVGIAACGLTGAALVLAQLWFFNYAEVFALEPIVWLVVLRDAVLVALALLLALPLAQPLRRKTSTPSSA